MEEFNSIKNRPKILDTNQMKSPSRLFFNSAITSTPCHKTDPSDFQQKLRKSYNFNTLTNNKPIKTFHLTSSKSITNDMDSFIYPSSMSPESTISSISSVSTLSNDNSNINKIHIENTDEDYKSKIYIPGQSNINRIQIGTSSVVLRRQQNPNQCDNDTRIKRAMSTCLNVNTINKFIEPKVNIDASTFKQPLLPITSNNLPLSSFRNSLLIEKSASNTENCESNQKVMSKSDIYQLSKSTKRWRSMYALRDSIRNLTSCVSSKASFINYKKNAPIIKINSEFAKNSEESLKECEYFEEMSVDTDMDAYSYCGMSMLSVRDSATCIGNSGSYLKCKTSDNLYESNKKLDESLIGNASNLLANNNVFSSCSYLSPRSNEQNMSENLHADEIRPITNSNTSVNTIKKIKIKKKKSAQKQQQKECPYLAKDDDLYDMIEKIQGDRLDNQRCELVQDCSVTKFFDDKYSLLNERKMINRVSNTVAKSSTARLENMLSRPGLYPMVSLPENDHYWSEGWKYEDESNFSNDLIISSSSLSSPSSSSSSSPSPSAESSNFGVKISSSNFDSSTDNLRETYMPRDNLVFYGRNQFDEPFVLSYSNQGSELTAIFRLKDTNYLMAAPLSVVQEPIHPDKIIQLILPDFRTKFIYPLVNLNGFNLIKEFDNHSISKHFKFGVIYMKKGQTTEEELFSNQEHSEEFDNFLSILGERIKLKDFEGFRGGLDTSHGQTGEYSVYEQYQDKEIMFHVSTLLPYSKNDSQQLERKRHIGNDIVAIVFQEDNTPFAPDMIASNFLHAFIIVQKFEDPSSSKTKYRISVAARKDVPNFGPPISNDSIFENDWTFKEWLLNKLINAEYSCYKAEKFKKLKERTRFSLLEKLYNDLNNQNQSILGSLIPSLADASVPENTSMRIASEISSSSASGSPLISSANSTSTHNLSSSTSFKFSLINTVRKAFKKDSKDKDLHSSRTSLSKPRSGTVSAVPLSSPSNSPATTPSSENYPTIASKIRSMTFDSSTEHSSNQVQAPTKNQLKNQISAPEEINKKLRQKYINYNEHHLAKIGSIDSLNITEKDDILKKRLFSLIPQKNANGSMTDLTNKSYVSSSGSSLPEDDEIEEPNDNVKKQIQLKS